MVLRPGLPITPSNAPASPCCRHRSPSLWETSRSLLVIAHLTKTVVTAFGDDEGWDAELGLKTEIVPLSKPYGLYVWAILFPM